MQMSHFSLKNLLMSSAAFLLTACGGGADLPNYDEMQTPQVNDRPTSLSTPSWIKMANSFRIAGDYSNAIRLYQNAANEDSTNVPSRVALGQIYQRLGATDGAIVYYRQALDLDPENLDAQLGLGQMMVTSNKPLEAISYLESVAKKSPDNYRIYNSIGLAYDLEGLHEKAQLAYGEGLNKKPDHISLLNNLALSFAIDGEYAPSIQLLSKAINLDYSQTTAQRNLIMVYALSGEEEAAKTMAKTFMTPVEIEENILHYNWLKTLSSKRRAQAIFLNLKSFPVDEEETTTEIDTINDTATKSQSVVIETDPKRQMLNDILSSEEGLVEGALSEGEMLISENFYHLQIGSKSTVGEVIAEWDRIKKLAPDMLTDTKLDVEKVINANDEEMFRLYIGNFDNNVAADEFCKALMDKQISCSVEILEALSE